MKWTNLFGSKAKFAAFIKKAKKHTHTVDLATELGVTDNALRLAYRANAPKLGGPHNIADLLSKPLSKSVSLAEYVPIVRKQIVHTTRKANNSTLKHLVIPDTQCKPGVPLDHLDWANGYIRDKKPDVIINLKESALLKAVDSWMM
jgi:hypothetical protein